MNRHERQLRRHLLIAVLVKVAVLAVLWWVFVRDAGVSVDAGRIAEAFSGIASSQGVSK